jgi:hypothetical protein
MTEPLRVLGSRKIERVEMNSDDYVSASIRVLPRSYDRLVLTVNGDDGGWMELVLGARDGAVEEVTITTPLPLYEPRALTGPLDVIPDLPRLATERLLESSREVDFARLVHVDAPLAEGRRGGDRCVRIAAGVPTTRYESCDIGALVAADGTLLEIVIGRALTERATPFD